MKKCPGSGQSNINLFDLALVCLSQSYAPTLDSFKEGIGFIASGIKETKENRAHFIAICDNDGDFKASVAKMIPIFADYTNSEIKKIPCSHLVIEMEESRENLRKNQAYEKAVKSAQGFLNSHWSSELPAAQSEVITNLFKYNRDKIACLNTTGRWQLGCYAFFSVADPTMILGAAWKAPLAARLVSKFTQVVGREKNVIQAVEAKNSVSLVASKGTSAATSGLSKASKDLEVKLASMPIKEKKAGYGGVAEKEIEPLGGGAHRSYLAKLQDGTLGVWKPEEVGEIGANYRAEILAYQVDSDLGFNIVPPTVERTINSETGSFQLYMKSVEKDPKPSEKQKMQLFDFIIDNRDRHQGNYLVSRDRKIIAIDNGSSFTGEGDNGTSYFRKRKDIEAFLKTDEGKQIVASMKQRLDDEEFTQKVLNALGAKDTERLAKRMRFIIKQAESNNY
jgi:hypothetical protein